VKQASGIQNEVGQQAVKYDAELGLVVTSRCPNAPPGLELISEWARQ